MAHPQALIQIHHLGIHGRRKYTCRRVAGKRAVIFRLPGKFLKTVKAVLPLPGPPVQFPVILLLPQISAAAHCPHAGDKGIHPALRDHCRHRHCRHRLQGIPVLPGPIQMQKHGIHADKHKGQKLDSQFEILMLHKFLAEQEEAYGTQITVQN